MHVCYVAHFCKLTKALKMSRCPKSRPFFFKVMLGDFANKLKIPPKFVKNFKGNVPIMFSLKSNAGAGAGRSWTVQVQYEEGRYYFCGGWPNFVRDHGLQVGEFLVFTMFGSSIFHVLVGGRSCCEKDITLAKRRGRPAIRRQNHEEKPTKRGASTSKKERGANVKRERNVGHDVEFVTKSPPEHHSFEMVFKRYEKYSIVIARRFAKAAGMTTKRSMIAEDPRGRMWVVGIIECQNQIRLSAGWPSFWKENGLVVGDALSFQFIAKTGTIRIQFVKRAGDGDGRKRNKRANA